MQFLKDVISTTIFSVIGKSIGFAIPLLLATWFGVNANMDAFFFAYGLIFYLTNIFAPVLERLIVPFAVEKRRDGDDIGKFIGEIIYMSSGLLFFVSILFFVLIKYILNWVTEFDESSIELIFSILVEICPLMILVTCSSILAGAINSYKKFAMPALSPGIRCIVNLIVIYILKNKYGIHAIAFGFIAGEIARLVALILTIIKLKLFKISFRCYISLKQLSFFKTAIYQTIGMVAVGLNPIVDSAMASGIGNGAISLLYYADKLYMIPVIFLTTGLMVTLLSQLSELYYEIGPRELHKKVIDTMSIVSIIALPIMLLLIWFHQPITNLAFGRKTISQVQLNNIGELWVYYLYGFVPFIVGRVLIQANITIKNTKAIMVCAFFVNILNILLNYIFLKYFGIVGIAISTSFVYVFSLIFMGITFFRSIKENINADPT